MTKRFEPGDFLESVLETSLWLAHGSELSPEARMESMAHLLVPQLAEWCGIDVLIPDGTLERVVTVHVEPEKRALAQRLVRQYPPKMDAPIGAPAVVRTGRAQMGASIDDEQLRSACVDETQFEILSTLGLGSYLCVPLLDEERVLGAVTLVRDRGREPFSDRELELVQRLADRAGESYAQTRALGEKLQSLDHDVMLLNEYLHETGFAFIAMKLDWTIGFVNAQAEKTLQVRAADLVGKVVWDAFPETEGGLFREAALEARAANKPVTLEDYSKPLQRYFQIHLVPTEKHLLSYFVDVTEFKELLERERVSRLQAEEGQKKVSELVAELSRQRDELTRANEGLSRTTRDLASQQEQLLRLSQTLRYVNRVGMRLLEQDSVQEAVEKVMQALSDGFRSKHAGVWLAAGRNTLTRRAEVGLNGDPTPSLPETVNLDYDSHKLAWVGRYQKPFSSSELRDDIQFDHEWLQRNGLTAASFYPVSAGTRLQGVICFFLQQPLPLEMAEIGSTLAALFSVALDRISDSASSQRKNE
jgi:hypothetical protein